MIWRNPCTFAANTRYNDGVRSLKLLTQEYMFERWPRFNSTANIRTTTSIPTTTPASVATKHKETRYKTTLFQGGCWGNWKVIKVLSKRNTNCFCWRSKVQETSPTRPTRFGPSMRSEVKLTIELQWTAHKLHSKATILLQITRMSKAGGTGPDK